MSIYKILFLTMFVIGAHGQSSTEVKLYADLNHQVYCCIGWSPGSFVRPSEQREEEIAARLHDLVTDVVGTALSRPSPTSESVRLAVAEMQGAWTLKGYLSKIDIPWAEVGELNGSPTLVVAFAVLTGGQGIPDVRPAIQFYSHATGVWRLHNEAGAEFRGTTFSIAPIPSPIPSEVWYLLWGMQIGDTGARLKLRVYAFDGFTVRTAWQREGLRGGDVTISGRQITLNYYERITGSYASPDRYVSEILYPTLNGLEK